MDGRGGGLLVFYGVSFERFRFGFELEVSLGVIWFRRWDFFLVFRVGCWDFFWVLFFGCWDFY